MIREIFKYQNVKILLVLYGVLALSIAVIIYTAVRVNSITHSQNVNYNHHLRYHLANASFRQGTDLLTEAVRRAVVTMNPQYIDDYFNEVQKGRHRDRALAMVRNLRIDQSLKDALVDAMRESHGLMGSEYHAMHLISLNTEYEKRHPEIARYPLSTWEREMTVEQRRERAEELLWDDAYIRTKVKIYAYLSSGLEQSGFQAKAQHMQLRKQLLSMLFLSAVSLIIMVMTICEFVLYRRRQHERMVEAQAEENARMNAQLKAERDKAIKAEKARSYFFSTVSHDIRTPLNSIIGFSEMLQLGIDDPEEKEKALDAIITSGQTLLELINDVLDLSKLESGKMELHPVPTDVATLIGKVATSFEAALGNSSVRLCTEVGEMPFLKLDPQRIRQILFNLIGNAVKFTDKGSITVRASYDGGTFSLSVADTGCGISPENIGKLMSPYVQLQEHDSTKGTGLGLAICKQLSQQMKGTLEIESTLGEGSTFTLRIPKVEAVSKTESAAYLREREASGAAAQLDESVTGKHILIVDDQKLNLRILQTMLGRLGIAQVLTAENGREALKILRAAGDVDIVLTDMTMPIMDGAQLVSEIRKESRFDAVPVYVITADVEMHSRYRQLGFDDILIKPITLEKLKELFLRYAPRRSPDDGGAKA